MDLEPLWERRLDDFDRGASVLEPADLENRQTYEARHNESAIDTIISGFRERRQRILPRLERMSPSDLARASLQPRLRQPMSVVDLCFFVAEHDDHHLAAIDALAHRSEEHTSEL